MQGCCEMTDTRRRVKLYELNAERQWDDKGTGEFEAVTRQRQKIALSVRPSDMTVSSLRAYRCSEHFFFMLVTIAV